ncbi:hypothetical protein A0H81_03631 [Grifola frondosa]|uniref:Uncharacterized protein n=1 Tax=Grifola frondosa TaxID=5627 RepID=A0A1C7MJS9_GRIFR|nr:hypothetical protein A0H81_03631 [Grifola frondosa]
MTAAPDSSRSERLSYHYPPSPPSSATVTAPSSPRPDSEPRKDRIFISSVAPRRTTSHKIPIRNKWPHDRQSDSALSASFQSPLRLE